MFISRRPTRLARHTGRGSCSEQTCAFPVFCGRPPRRTHILWRFLFSLYFHVSLALSASMSTRPFAVGWRRGDRYPTRVSSSAPLLFDMMWVLTTTEPQPSSCLKIHGVHSRECLELFGTIQKMPWSIFLYCTAQKCGSKRLFGVPCECRRR